ncbi:unnamed protein product [Schistosoma rodhaini]|nr:unnamed protein product [Schistosoma rodhaini]
MPSKIRIVLEGYARYRDGKKWKKRYCVLSLSPTTPDALHLYITKSYDDFAAYRNSGSVLTAMLPPVRKLHELPISPESRALLSDTPNIIQRSSDHNQNTLTSQSSTLANYCPSITTSSGPLINTAAHSYNTASGNTLSGLATASNLASSVGGPAPVDEITGFESGYHMDKESNIIVLIGGSSVYALALAGMDEMFCWADNLARIVVDNRFRVTLRHSGDGSKLFQGLQGSLHVQHWRLCLIGEPSTGCKFICNWRLDHVDKAYTMTMPAQSANQLLSNNSNNNSTSTSTITTTSNSMTGITNNSTTFISANLTTPAPSISSSSFNTGNPLNLDHHRTGSRTGLTTMSTVPTTTLITSPSTTAFNNPNKYLFFMECSPASGKGRGSYIFEIDGSRLAELTIAIEQFTALRYNPNLKPATCAEASQLTVTAQSNLGTTNFGTIDRCNKNDNLFRNGNPPICTTIPTNIGSSVIDDLGIASSSFSSDTSSNPRSVSPTHHHQQQQQLTKRRSRDSIFNPLRKISSGHHNFNLFKANDYQSSTIDRLFSKQTMSQFIVTTATTTTTINTATTTTSGTEQSLVPVLHSKYSWNFQRTSSLSPPDMIVNDSILDSYNPNSLSRFDHLHENSFKEQFNLSGGGGVSVVATTIGVTTNDNIQEGNNSPIEILNSLDKTSHNAGDFSTVSNPDQSSMSNSNNNNNPLTSSICSCSPLWNTGTNNNSNTFPISSSSRLVDDVNVSSSSSSSSLMIGRDIIRNMSETNYFLDDNIQVAKVAAGLIISKKPPYYHHHQQQHCSGSGYPTRISGLTPVSTIFTGASNTTSTSTACGAVKTGNCKQSLPSTVPSFRFSSTSSTRHHRHTHHHRFIFDGPNSSGNQSSSGCSTTAVLPSVPIPSIGTNSDINHNFMHSSLSSSSEYNRTQLHPESLLSKQRQYSQQYHNSLLNFISSCQTYNSLNTSTSDLNCSTTTTSSSVESTLDQVDNNKNICDTDKNITNTTTTTTTTCVTSIRNSSNHEIFTADEDYWDLRDNSNCQHKLIIQSSKMDSTIVGVADTSKESDNLCVMTGAIPSDSVELHTCKESSPYPCELNQFTNTPFIYPHFYLSSIEPSQCIYRHRLQQYRVCNCISLLRRSFSANSNIQFIDLSNNDLQIFNFRPSLTLRTMRSLDSCIVPRSKSINDNSSIEKTIGATDHDSKLYRTLQSYSTNPHISVQSPLCKSFCGGRFQKIHRLFHRKQHSQSHDNLECSKTSVDRSKLLNDIDFDTQLWDEVKSKHILCTNIPFWNCTGNDADTDETHENRFDRILDLSYRIFICPRHGVQSLHWNFSSDDGQQHISRLNTSRRDSVFQSKKLLKSTPVNQKHSNVSTLLPHLLNSIALPRPLSLVRLTTEKSKYHCRKSFEHYIKNKESKVTNLNFDKDSNDGNNDITSSIIDVTSSHTLPKNKISHSLPPSNTTISSSTLTNQSYSFSPNNNYYYYAPISNRCPSLISLNSSSCSEPCLSKINLIHSLSSSFSVDYNHELLEGRKLLSLNKDTSESSNNSQQYESLISSSSLSRNMKERNNNNNDSMLSDAQKLCHSEMMTVGSSVLLSSPSSSPPIPSIDLKYHPLFRCNNTVEKSLVGSLSNYCDVEFLNELRLHLLRMNSHHNVISNNNNMPGQIESSQQRKNVNDIVGENVTCIHDMQHGSNDDSDMLQSSLYSDKQTQSLSSSASSSGGLTTTKSSDITWSKALYGNSTIDSNINESNYSINQLSCNSSTSNSNNRQSYLSKLFDRSFSSNAKSLSPSIISPTIRANTLPTTRILRQQSIDHKNTWNNINNHLICVNSSKVDTTNQDIIANGNSINQKVNNRLYFLHHSDHRNSAMQDNHHHFKINTTISSDKANNVLTRKFSHQSEIDHFSRIMTTNISSSNNNNKNNVNRRSRKSDEQLNDKSTLSSCNVEQQIPVEYPVYNNLIELRENVRPLSNDGVGSMLTYDLKSIPSLLSSVITSISGSLPSESLLSSQSLHVTINEDNGFQHHHLNQSTTANYVNLPMFWSNHHSTTTPTPSSMFSRSSTSCQRQHSTDVTTTATTTIEPRLYANIMPSNTTSKYQSVRNKQQSKTDFSLLSKNHIRHSGSGIPPSVADCTGNSSSSSNSSLTGESQMPSGVVIDHNSKIMDISEKSHSLDPTSVINLIPTTTATIPQYCPVAVVARAQEAANLPTNSDYSNLPDEVRDPSRNYAMVDLRPSPASSTIPPAELTLNIIQHHNDNRTGQFTTCNSSSTSTGSSSSGDCTSDAATLTSDTIESYETIGASNNNHSYNNSKLNKLKTKNSIDTDSYGGRGDDDNLLTGSISSSRRRHSHSLSSVTTTDHPSILLNYIHVIAASNGRFTSLTTTTDGTVQLSGPCSVGDSNHNHNNKSLICDFGNSPNSSNSSSSALGGVTSSSSSSHSTGSSLVPVSSTSFGDTFSCRSMTSSGISSVEGGGGVAVSDMIELSSCSPSDENCVNYTQIDFARTMALGELSGDIMAQENQMLHKLPSTATGIRIANRWSSSSSNKIDRTTSVKKTLCRSIRLIGRGTRKKVG